MKILYIGRCPPHRSGVAIQHSMLINGLAHKSHSVIALDPITPTTSAITGGYDWEFHEGVKILKQHKCSFKTSTTEPGTTADRRRYAAFMQTLLPALLERHRPDLIFLGGEYFAHGITKIVRQLKVPVVLSARPLLQTRSMRSPTRDRPDHRQRHGLGRRRWCRLRQGA